MPQPDLPAPDPSDISPLRLRAQSYKHSWRQRLKGGWPETPPQPD